MTAADRESRLLDGFSTLADTLVEDFDVIDVLQTLVDTCAAVLAVDAAGVLLADPDTEELDLVASTDESSRIVEAMQLSALAGPCVDAYRDARPISVTDIAELQDRFGPFRDSALAQGFRSVFALPMRLRSTTIGTLNLFGMTAGDLDDADRRAARALADIATLGILQARSIRAAVALQHQLQRALNSRVLIEQAKGVLAHSHDLTMEQAFRRLREHARAHRMSLVDVAQGVVERSLLL